MYVSQSSIFITLYRPTNDSPLIVSPTIEVINVDLIPFTRPNPSIKINYFRDEGRNRHRGLTFGHIGNGSAWPKVSKESPHTHIRKRTVSQSYTISQSFISFETNITEFVILKLSIPKTTLPTTTLLHVSKIGKERTKDRETDIQHEIKIWEDNSKSEVQNNFKIIEKTKDL